MDALIDRLPIGARHALIALAIMGLSLIPLSLLHALLPTVPALVASGGLCGVWFYISRERRQAEEAAGSNRIPPWQLLPRSWRDIGWPVAAVVLATVLTWALFGGH